MSNFKDNPAKPFEVRVPNKIRKRIAMHECRGESGGSDILSIWPASLKKTFSLRTTPTAKKRGSMWSRFTDRIKKFLG